MIIAGVDIGGRRVAVSIFVDGVLTNVTDLEVPKSTRARELRTLAIWAGDNLRVCDLVLVEEPLIGRGVRASLQVAQTAGAVLATLGDTVRDTRSDWVSNTTWKREVVGSGNANKEAVALWLKSSHPSYSAQCGESQDRRDAVCIGLYAVQLAERATQLAEL